MVLDAVKRAFVNEREGRLRAGWRLLVQGIVLAVTFLALSLAVSFGALLVGIGLPTPATAGTVGLAVGALVQFVVVLVSVLPVARYVDRRPLDDLGLGLDRAWIRDCVVGLLLGAGLMTLVFLVEYALGWIRVIGTFRAGRGTFLVGAGAALVAFVSVGIYEELLSRGYHLTNVAEGVNGLFGASERTAVGVASALSAATFAVLHLGNPNASAASTLGIFTAGLFLSAGYVLTGRLGLPVGVHVTWNYFQAIVYGFPVSGFDPGVAVVAIEQGGPTLFTGGRFGPEAGLLGVGAALLGTAVVVAWVRARGETGAWRDVATYTPREGDSETTSRDE